MTAQVSERFLQLSQPENYPVQTAYMTGSEAYEFAKRKARYGHKCWIVWQGRTGLWFAELESARTVKQAMLAVGTKGRWTAINGLVGHVQRWQMGLIYLRNAKFH